MWLIAQVDAIEKRCNREYSKTGSYTGNETQWLIKSIVDAKTQDLVGREINIFYFINKLQWAREAHT